MYVIDRTKNPHGKAIPNTTRFMERAKEEIRRSVAYHINTKNMSDATDGKDNKIIITGQGLREPSFWVDYEISDWIKVMPGNPKNDDSETFFRPFNLRSKLSQLRYFMNMFDVGDEIYKPPSAGSGKGPEGSEFGDGEDEFIFSLGQDDWTKFLFDQLSLPNQDPRKTVMKSIEWKRAGLTTTGSPANLNLVRTMRNAMGRRIGLSRPKEDELLELLAELEQEKDETKRVTLEEKLNQMRSRMNAVPWIDPIDVRYATHIKEPVLKFNAVMFCLMDVSGSMTEHMKMLAKYFYVFLYRFLKSKYERVELVFIRHTHVAKEVDEDTFFHSPETGGTIVSTALEEMKRVIRERYDPKLWNIYGAQVSDGDNWGGDNDKCLKLLRESLLPITQYYTYIEVAKSYAWAWGPSETDLWQSYKLLAAEQNNFVMDKIKEPKDLWPIMCRLFGEK